MKHKLKIPRIIAVIIATYTVHYIDHFNVNQGRDICNQNTCQASYHNIFFTHAWNTNGVHIRSFTNGVRRKLYSRLSKLGCSMKDEKGDDSVHTSIKNYDVDVGIDIVRAETIRWCDNFVVKMNLCPWANASMQAFHSQKILGNEVSDREMDEVDERIHNDQHRHSVTMKFIELSTGMGFYEAQTKLAELVRDEASLMAMEEVAFISKESNAKLATYNPTVAITFIVVVPVKDDSMGGNDADWIFKDDQDGFESFHDAVVFIEEDYLPSFRAPENVISALVKEGYIENIDDTQEDVTLADLVAIAGFHPAWEFGSGSSHDPELQAVSYEKRSPFPTITIVHWSAIDKGFDGNSAADVTDRISSHNSEVLTNAGKDCLQEIYARDVRLKRG